MEWNNNKQKQSEGEMMVVEGLCVKVRVMTDEQMEVLRKQIAAYASICEQLVAMHKSISAQYDVTGMRLGNPYLDPFMSCGVHKIPTRQRWTPTPVQLQILERVYEECNGNPGKQKILELTKELEQHGHIRVSNVYNWFQNRRARIKRKQTNVTPSNAEAEQQHVLSEKSSFENLQSFDYSVLRADHFYLQSPDLGAFNPLWQVDSYNSLDDA